MCVLPLWLQAYEGLKTADRLKEEYVFIPAKVKEVYLTHLLTESLPAAKVSAHCAAMLTMP